MAAATAARSDPRLRVAILEKNRKIGVKILMSGGTRCNLTHDCGPSGIMEAFGSGGSFLRQSLAALSPSDVVQLFDSLGVPTKIEASTGKIFPASNRAIDVRDALVRHATSSGVAIFTQSPVLAIDRSGECFDIATPAGNFQCDRLIITTGGQSYPGCGTTGDGYAWLKRWGHTIIATRPALVPLVGGSEWMREMSGLTLDHAITSVWELGASGGAVGKRPMLSRRGGFLFTHFGFSGPAAMDVSGTITAFDDLGRVRLTLDVAPDWSSQEITRWLDEQRQTDGRRQVVAALGQRIPKRLAERFAQTAGVEARTFAELPRAAATHLVTSLKQLPLPVTGTRGYEKAEVTAGGVSLKEVDPRTMQSRIQSGLFLAGEILDLDGWIGGYNFQSAFSTAYVAGMAAASMIQAGDRNG